MAKKNIEKKSEEIIQPEILPNALVEENNYLRTELEQLKAMISNMVKPAETTQSTDISLNKVVRVMSLFTGGMTLKTSEHGRTFRFNEFGDVQPIIYGDLVQIMSYQHRFCKEGYFAILDKDVIIAQGLEEVYKKILDKKTIENILTFSDDKIRELFLGTTDNIRESIISIVTNKLNGNDSVDKNKVHLLSELCGIDLFAYARGDVEALVNSKG